MKQKKSPILFLNVGWMEKYAGPNPGDPTIGNFGWLSDKTHGHECYNFADQNGWCFGNHPSGAGTAIEKLGAPKGAPSIDNILVVWFSKSPHTGKAVVIGWYQNATVYRTFQTPTDSTSKRFEGEVIAHKVKAKASDCILLRDEDRRFPIPSAHRVPGGYGQSANWYGKRGLFCETVREYIETCEYYADESIPRQTGAPKQDDSELRREVEKIAIEIAKRFYRSAAGGGRTVKSVELDCKGWDLEAVGPADRLLIEVKGLSGSQAVAELTPNEFEQMRRRCDNWVLFMVVDCLGPSPKQIEFRHGPSGEWRSGTGQKLKIVRKIGAVVSCQA